jgi:hypothetical protein
MIDHAIDSTLDAAIKTHEALDVPNAASRT